MIEGRLCGTRHRWTEFAEARTALAGRRGLFIGDDVESGGRAFLSLTHAGAQVRLVRRWMQIQRHLDEATPTLIVIDLDGVEGRGAELARTLRRAPATARAVIVGLIPSGFQGHRRRLLAAGFDELMAKPVDPRSFAQELVGTVTRLRSPGG
jgi:DNA-binding response OmpR family regulator